MRDDRTIRAGAMIGRTGLALVLAALVAWPSASPGDTLRVKTDRGIFLVEVDGTDVAARGDGDDLVITRDGEEYRLNLISLRADVFSRQPLLSIRRDGKAIVTARCLPNPSALSTAAVPGRTILNPKALSPAWSLAITPDGRTLLSGHQGFLRVWDPSTLAERFNVPINKVVRRVALTPDGSTIASAEYSYVAQGKAMGSVVIRDGNTGVARKEMKPVESMHGVAIDPTGKVVVSTSWSETSIRVWDVETGEQVGTLKGHSGSVGTVVYSPDGKTLASGGDSTIRLWDVDTGTARKILRGHQGPVESVAYSLDGKTLASGAGDNDARVWDVETGKLLATLESDDPVLTVALTPDGKSVATAAARWGNGFYGSAPSHVQVWDVATGKPLFTLPDQAGQVFAMVFRPDGKSLITASLAGAVTLWDLAAFPAAKDASKAAQPPKP